MGVGAEIGVGHGALWECHPTEPSGSALRHGKMEMWPFR